MRRVNKEKQISYNKKILILSLFPIISLTLALIMGGEDLISNYSKILREPGLLLTDYIQIGGFYANLLNIALVSLVNLGIIYFFKMPINGLIFASYFFAMGFASFGKTPVNIIPIYIGGLLYSYIEKVKYRSIFGVMMFSTGIAPIVSYFLFNNNLNILLRISIGLSIGIIVGLIMPPISSHMLKLHDGYNLYNVGFTAGMVAHIFVAVTRGQGLEVEFTRQISNEYDFELKILLTVLFIIYIFIGYIINRYSFAGYDMLMSTSGRLLSDYILTEGFGISLINSGILGLLSIAFVSTLETPLNGPLIAAIFSIVGFGAFGKHPVNCTPIIIGVLFGGYISAGEISKFNLALTALFSTTMAPIVGSFGPYWGVLAGFLHYYVVGNIGIVHGGINLYNNGFSGGLIIGFLLPIIHKYDWSERAYVRKYKKNH